MKKAAYIDYRDTNKLSSIVNLSSGEPILRYTIIGNEKK